MVDGAPSPIEWGGAASLHDLIVARLSRPAWLKTGSLMDHTWVVQLDDGDLKRHAGHKVNFDVVLAPGGMRSTHPSLEHDLITAKIIAYRAQMPRFRGGVTQGSAYTPIIIRDYFHFVRWRLSRGIPTNADLTPDWLDELFATVRTAGLVGLLPLQQRTTSLLENYTLQDHPLPSRRTAKGARALQMTPIAHQLGVQSARSLSPSSINLLRESAAAQGLVLERSAGQGPRPGKILKTDGSARLSTVTASRLMSFLRPIELLRRYKRHLGHDPIAFDPFPQSRTAWQVAESLSSKDIGRTPTIPAEQACHLINSALLWVLDYSDDLLRLHDAMRGASRSKSAGSERFRHFRRVAQSFEPESGLLRARGLWPTIETRARARVAGGELPVRSILFRLLPAACMIVIAAFSARRHDEIDSLRADCVECSDDDYWMEAWISKTIRDINKIPVPASVAKAIGILEHLSGSRRLETTKPWIFDFADPFDGLHRPFDQASALRQFVEFADVPALPDGSKWWFSPHQFRRFFGIIYYHHYRFGHLAALSNFYRHFDPDMTRLYINEAANGGFLRRAEERRVTKTANERRQDNNDQARLTDFRGESLAFRIERYSLILAGLERVSGFGGEALQRELTLLVAEVRSRVEIGGLGDEESALNQALAEFASDRRLEPNPQGHSYCKCRAETGDLEAAACISKSDVDPGAVGFLSAPDPTFAADLICSGCPHNVQLPENEPYWINLVAHETAQLECAFSPAFRCLTQSRLAAAKAHVARCFGNA